MDDYDDSSKSWKELYNTLKMVRKQLEETRLTIAAYELAHKEAARVGDGHVKSVDEQPVDNAISRFMEAWKK